MAPQTDQAIPAQRVLAQAMRRFVDQIPASAGLEWVKDDAFLYFFEAERLLAMHQVLVASGFIRERPFRVLDFGYLHGLVPEFLHRFFPQSRITVLDHPSSPNFRNPEYLRIIQSRTYLELHPCDIANVAAHKGQYDLIVLGEIIEHLDPTVVGGAVASLRSKIADTGCLLITTPNAAGARNSIYTFFGRDAQHPPIPDGTMNYGHIHLWTSSLLGRTLSHFGWAPGNVCFTHGFERKEFSESNRHWGSLRHQIMTKALYVVACLRPSWRGFMVSTWNPLRAGSVSDRT